MIKIKEKTLTRCAVILMRGKRGTGGGCVELIYLVKMTNCQNVWVGWLLNEYTGELVK